MNIYPVFLNSTRWAMLCNALLGLLLVGGTVAQADEAAVADADSAAGLAAFQHGDFEQAVRHWQAASAAYTAAGQRDQQINALVQLADAYQALGKIREALPVLEQARQLSDPARDPARAAAVLNSLGQVYWLVGKPDEARQLLETGIGLAEQAGTNRVAATGLNNLGNLLSDRGDYPAARARYQAGLALARRSDDPVLTITLLLNAARAAGREQQTIEALALLDEALVRIRRLPPSHERAVQLLAAGQLLQTLPGATPREQQQAYQAFHEAASLAESLRDQRALSYAWGYQSRLYRDQQRDTEALQLSRRAVFAAQQAHAPELLYQWEWQIGRLLARQGDQPGAILAYQQAVNHLQIVRPEVTATYAARRQTFKEAVGDLYYELVDLLLRQAARERHPPARQRYLTQARDTLEDLKGAELKDYFKDDCGTAAPVSLVSTLLPPQTALFYPILLPDRTELLLDTGTGLQQFQVPVGRAELTQTVREFRRYLEKRNSREYLPAAQQLYRWLLTPLQPALQAGQVTTVVIVPDGPLRTVPLAALHDGRDFLISHYAVATTPSLALTEWQPLARAQPQVLLNGLSTAVQGFPPLRYVSDELATIHTHYGGTLLQDQRFRIPNVRQELTTAPYTIVHIASHGQFASDVNRTFILTFDDKLTMDRLENLMTLSQDQGKPVELLTLSACQTAAGDDRAALGLAGIAVKAGARSALATLWFINDQASTLLVTEFYRQLQQGLSKATALQQAQRQLLRDPRYQHPGYWSPFLLIGNWL